MNMPVSPKRIGSTFLSPTARRDLREDAMNRAPRRNGFAMNEHASRRGIA